MQAKEISAAAGWQQHQKQQQQEEGVSTGIHALACFLLATWRPACFETGRCCPVRLCGLVACYERCVHKGQRGKSYAERGGTNDLSSHTAVVTHGSSNGDVDGLMLFSRHLHQHVDVRRGAEIGCKPNRLPGASAPRNAARRSGRLPNPSDNNG